MQGMEIYDILNLNNCNIFLARKLIYKNTFIVNFQGLLIFRKVTQPWHYLKFISYSIISCIL